MNLIFNVVLTVVTTFCSSHAFIITNSRHHTGGTAGNGGRNVKTMIFHNNLDSSSSNTLLPSQINGDGQKQQNQQEQQDLTETIRQQSLVEFEEAMEHFMFELGNEMIFLSNQKEVSSYIEDKFDTIIFDCDGVLYRGMNPIPEAIEALNSLIQTQKKQVLFITNNAGSSRKQLKDKLVSLLKCDLLTEEQMISSSYSAAKYLQKELELNGNKNVKDCNVHVIGTSGLCEELKNFGFHVTGGPNADDDNHNKTDKSDKIQKTSMSREELESYTFEKEEQLNGNKNDVPTPVDAVVIGLDTEFNYRKLCIANVLLQRHPNALLVATNEDAYDLVGSDSRHLPGNGSLVKAVESASQRKAINVGKPSKILANLLREEFDLDLSRTLMVGDRLDTDVKFGKDGGMKSALVLTGCTTANKLEAIGDGTDDEPLPHIIFPHMGMMGLDVETL